MAIDAKYDFMRRTEEILMDKITSSDLAKVMSAMSDILEGFDMQAISGAPEKDDMLDSFLAAMKVTGRSQKTIDRYAYIIRRMMEFVKVSTRQISVYHLRAYIAAEKERGISESTLEGYREIFTAYFNWLQRESLIEKNPTANIGRIKVPKRQKQIYTDVDLEKLMRVCESKRDRALISFLASTGCRVGEVVELDRDQVDLEKLQCVVHGKGDKERVVYLDAVTGMLLREYLSERTDDDPALFYSKKGNRLATNSIRLVLTEAAKKAGLEKVPI